MCVRVRVTRNGSGRRRRVERETRGNRDKKLESELRSEERRDRNDKIVLKNICYHG